MFYCFDSLYEIKREFENFNGPQCIYYKRH